MPYYASLFFFLLVVTPDSYAFIWPVVTTHVSEGNSTYPPYNPLYSGSTSMLNLSEPTIPKFNTQITGPVAMSAWCGDNNNCFLSSGIAGAPITLSNCDFADPKSQSWELKAGSTCTLSGIWADLGAKKIGSCVVIGTPRGFGMDTPWGYVNANEAVFDRGHCVVLPPPNETCTLDIAPSIHHGNLPVGTSDTKYVEGVVDCGTSPVVSVFGPSVITLAPGVSTRISASMSNSTSVRLQSDMTVDASATPGDYSAALVLSVSPN
ncbi:Uncharacterised protein [Serratia entomophila]|nr:Uncharacterised protein [Serratia entomophila]CAI1063892.1 Uncharacterised protein [Serratia entomophila]CAI1114503.1 Uncharacterised protein [Serratia entomophila]CAI1889137.1 Uncharacterised protein [Serratia entomophila]CAI1917386.1 Uncharacterised protein [Serratia entomophila]